MPNLQLRRTYLRAWRQHRGMTLRGLTQKIADMRGEPVVSYPSLARIEVGDQPYSQPILEALADALEVPVESLLAHDPKSPDRVWEIWSQMNPQQRRQAVIILETLLRAG